MRQLLVILFALATMGGAAQDLLVRRGNCMPDVESLEAGGDGSMAGDSGKRQLPTRRGLTPQRDWDPSRTYKQAVVLMTFAGDDTNFSMEDARQTYDRIFNEAGYNQRQGKGCVADYFRDQSGGMLNLAFDVYGPYEVSAKSQPYANPTEETKNYGRNEMIEATQKWFAENPSLDYKQYDWNGNGSINQVIYVYAGYCGNQSNTKSYGHIWPNTSTFSTQTAPDGTKVSNYTCSAELWVNNASCGIGTICHEFSHSLGLPDIYPVTSNAALPYSMLDEWDLMDGGNFTNYGWCPPNYTAHEKILLGWLAPTELTEAVSVSDMKPVAQGGEAYMIRHTDTEFLLLENRQQEGWDKGLPGKGLVVYHVNYVQSKWTNNTVNSTLNNYGFQLIPADNMDYTAWNDHLLDLKNQGLISSQYRNSPRLNSLYLSGAAYPWTDSESGAANIELTDTSVPATLLYTDNAAGSKLLGKPVTSITMTADGLVSFAFMGGQTTGIDAATKSQPTRRTFDLHGRPLTGRAAPGIRLERRADGTVVKILSR